jgi:hypothetical protein
MVSLILRRPQLSAMNPYIKPWRAEARRVLRRCDGAPQWYADTADIDGDMNPAHILHECLTDRVWGRGYSTAEIDEPSFRIAADTLYAEHFGLSTLKLTRDDYDPASLLELNETNVLRLESFERTLPEELVNQVTLSYHDRATDKTVSIAVQDIAGIERAFGEIKERLRRFSR